MIDHSDTVRRVGFAPASPKTWGCNLDGWPDLRLEIDENKRLLLSSCRPTTFAADNGKLSWHQPKIKTNV